MVASKKAAAATAAKGKKRAREGDAATKDVPVKKAVRLAASVTKPTNVDKGTVKVKDSTKAVTATSSRRPGKVDASAPQKLKSAKKGTAAIKTAKPTARHVSDDEESSDDAEQAEEDAAHVAASSTLKGLADLGVEMASDLEDDDDDNEQDEEDDKGVGRNAPIVDVVKLPSSKDEKAVKARLDAVGKKRKRDGASANVKAGVLYIGRIPRGFYENEMRSYFSQFGNVTRLRLSRNKKTGAPKHYGFIEFDDVEVAQIVQETMDNYLLMGHLLQVKMIPQDKVHADLFKGANRKWRGSTGTRRERTLHDQPRTKEEQEVVEKKLLQRQTQRKAALKKKGIEYGFPGYQVV